MRIRTKVKRKAPAVPYPEALEAAWRLHRRKKPAGAPRVVSTFAGCGGSSLGYSMAGFREVLAVEWDDHAVETYRRNFPGVPVFHGDIGKLTGRQARKLAGVKKGELELFDGSPPCQGFSVSGLREVDDDRNRLFEEFVRLLGEFMPRAFVMENVKGMAIGDMKGVFIEAVRSLKAVGYVVRCRLLDAKYFGVPQRRPRLIFLGAREDLGVEPEYPKPHPRVIPDQEAVAGLPEDLERTLSEKGLEYWKRTRRADSFKHAHPRGSWFNAYKTDPRQPIGTIAKMVHVTGSSGWFHWDIPRVMNIAEIKRCTSFPDGFSFEGDFHDQWARIGNSVPPLLMKAVAEAVRASVLEA